MSIPRLDSPAPTRVAIVRMVLAGCALAWGGAVIGGLVLWYLGLMPFSLGTMTLVSWLAMAGNVAIAGITTYQALAWVRDRLDRSTTSRRLAWLGYPATLLAIICWAIVGGTAGWGTPLSVMAGGAGLATLLGQTFAGVQHVRDVAEPPSTLGAAARDAVARSNAKADATLDATDEDSRA